MSVPRPPTPIEAWLTVPLAFSVSPGSIFTTVPAGTPAGRRSSGQPAKFCPKSNTHTPGCGFVSFTGVNVRWTFTGSALRAASFVVRFGGGAMPALRQPTSVPSRRFAESERSAESSRLAARVVVRAAEPVVGDRGAEGRAPVAVGDDGVARAVRVGDLEPPDQPRRDLRARARVERGQRVAGTGHGRARRVRRVQRRRERDAGAGRRDRGALGVGLAQRRGERDAGARPVEVAHGRALGVDDRQRSVERDAGPVGAGGAHRRDPARLGCRRRSTVADLEAGDARDPDDRRVRRRGGLDVLVPRRDAVLAAPRTPRPTPSRRTRPCSSPRAASPACPRAPSTSCRS